MREYIITVAAAALIAAITDIFSPQEWSKYIKIIVGFLILSIILAPVAKIKDITLIAPTAENISDVPLKDAVSEQLRQNIELDIARRMKDEFGIDCTAVAEIETDEKHNIIGVKAVQIKSWKNPQGMTERIKEIYGCDRVVVNFE